MDLRVVMATEMTEEPFSAFSFDGVLGLGRGASAPSQMQCAMQPRRLKL